jgi:hypothetical protein
MKKVHWGIVALLTASIAGLGCGKSSGLGLPHGDAGLGGAPGQAGGTAGGAGQGGSGGATILPIVDTGVEIGSVADAFDSPDASSVDQGCFLLCPASSTSLEPSGYVELSAGDSAVADPDSLEITACLDSQCVALPRESQYDSQAAQTACADAGLCEAKVYGSNTGTGYMYAYVVLARATGTLYSVSGVVMFRLEPTAAAVAGSTRITIQSAGLTYLDVSSSSDCTLNMGCCGNLPYQQCHLTWNN